MNGTGFYPTHSDLWACCEHLLKQGDLVDRGGFYFHLAGMLFAYLSYEAYVNFVGHFVAPDMWNDEKANFGSGDYRGIKGKLRLLEERLKLSIDKNSEPYSTVSALKEFREFLAHGKPEYYPVTAAAVRRDPNFPFNAKLGRRVTPANAVNAKNRVLELCTLIHEGASRAVSNRRLGDGPFSAVEEAEWSD